MALREKQREHSFIVLSPQEFSELTNKRRARLPARHFEHFGRILRRKAGWDALIGDGMGHLITARVEHDILHVTGDVHEVSPRPPAVALAQAWIKQKSLSIVLQKCSELGIAQIILIDSDFSSPHSEKPERMRTIIENACMQAYNPFVPSLTVARNHEEVSVERGLSFFGDLSAPLRISELPRNPGKPITFFNGPEGGWSNGEAESLRKKARGILLSENVLRAETAAIIAAGFLTLQ